MGNMEEDKQWKRYIWYLVGWAGAHQEIPYAGDSPLCYEEWRTEGKGADVELPECDSEYCAFNPKGYCLVPLIYSRQPGLNDDGCKDFVYREGVNDE